MNNINLLLEKSNKISLGIRVRQSGITLKEYFLNQRERAINIRNSQKAKITEAIKMAKDLSSKEGTINETVYIKITNKAGKSENKLVFGKGSTKEKAFNNLRKVIIEIYSIIKYRTSQIIKLCSNGISNSTKIIKGKSDSLKITETKQIKVNVMECNSLLNNSLAEMRSLFKVYHRIIK